MDRLTVDIRVTGNELAEENKALKRKRIEELQQAIREEEQVCCNCEDAMRTDICESCSSYRSISDLERELEELGQQG